MMDSFEVSVPTNQSRYDLKVRHQGPFNLCVTDGSLENEAHSSPWQRSSRGVILNCDVPDSDEGIDPFGDLLDYIADDDDFAAWKFEFPLLVDADLSLLISRLEHCAQDVISACSSTADAGTKLFIQGVVCFLPTSVGAARLDIDRRHHWA